MPVFLEMLTLLLLWGIMSFKILVTICDEDEAWEPDVIGSTHL